MENQYNRAKLWQIICFPFNNTATNVFMLLMMYVSYLAVGGYGLTVVTISTLLTATRIFDAVTDPIIGYLIDKTKTRFGKFRPIIILGYLIMAVSLILMYFLGIGRGIVVFVVLYLLYIIGYTFQTACTKSGQTCITNDPMQRPLFTRCDATYNLLLFSGAAVYVSNYLQPKYGDIGVDAMQEFCITALIISGILTILAILALWNKDVEENWGLGGSGKHVSFRDYVSVFKNNKAIRLLVVSASADKLTMTAASNSSIVILIYGIIINNYAFYGRLSLITLLPSILIIIFGTKVAQRHGSKKALVRFSMLSILFSAILLGVFLVFDPMDIGRTFAATTAFLVVYCIYTGVRSIPGNIVIPMIADCADYETYLSGRYVPGMMGTLFSFVDKIVSSFSNTIVGLCLAFIGYRTTLPQIGDAVNPQIFWVGMFTFIGLPVIGWIASLIAMKFYPLDEEKMREVQLRIAELKKS